MPHKPVDHSIVRRLRTLFQKEQARDPSLSRFYKFMGRLENVDHRREWRNVPSDKGLIDAPAIKEPRETRWWSTRVRALGVEKNYPSVRSVVLKRVHDWDAEKNLRVLRHKVHEYNLRVSPKSHKLLYPKAHVIGKDIIVMTRTECPSLQEILSTVRGTPRGLTFFERLKKRHPEVTLEGLQKVSDELFSNRFYTTDVILLGFKEGKYILMPLVDLS